MVKQGDIVKVVWLDAIGKTAEPREEVENTEPKDLLSRTTTYGCLFKDDEIAIMILQEDSQINVDYTVIPKSWILKITKLNGGKEN